MKAKMNFPKQLLSIFLCLSMLLTYLPITSMVALAAEDYAYKGGAGTKISDLDTSSKYSESLGDNASTEYAGRIWTDKSVYTGDTTFDVFGGGTSTIKLNENKTARIFLLPILLLQRLSPFRVQLRRLSMLYLLSTFPAL